MRKNTPDMVFLIFAVFLLVPLGLLFLIVSAGNIIYGDLSLGVIMALLGLACAGGLYYFFKKFRE